MQKLEDWAPLKATQYVDLINGCLQVHTVFNMCLTSSCWRDDNFRCEGTALKSCFCPVLYPQHRLSNAELLVLFTFYHCQPDSDFVFCVRLTAIMARLHSNERSCNGEPHSGRFMERQWKMLTHHVTHAKAGPLVGMFICPDKDALWCGPTAQRVQKQHSELEVILLVYFVLIPQKYQFISFFCPWTILLVYSLCKATLMDPNHTQS